MNTQRPTIQKPCKMLQQIKLQMADFSPVSTLLNPALDFLLPPHCVLCGFSSGSNCICTRCASDLPWPGPRCLRCALPLGSPLDKICGACVTSPPPFTRTICPLMYRFPADRLVQAFKFKRQLAAGRILSHLLCEAVCNVEMTLPNALIPVPMHKLRIARRGFNQAYELAGHTGKTIGIPLFASGLRRQRNTKAQSGLNRRERRKNVFGAFFWGSRSIPGSHLALVDDVMTTGATVTECARVLKKAGAKRVDVWVAARAIPAIRC